MDSMGYKGRLISCYYWKLWNERQHLVRMVDTYRLVDADRIDRSITFDIDNISLGLPDNPKKQMVLKNFFNAKKGSPNHNTIILPLLFLPKHPIFDIDAKIKGGSPIHLCRRFMNIDVTAHMIVGLCLFSGFVGDQHELYKKSIYFLGYDRAPSGSCKNAAKENVIKYAHVNGVRSPESKDNLNKFLCLLSSFYIHCVEYPIEYGLSEPTTIVKLRINESLESFSEHLNSLESDLTKDRLILDEGDGEVSLDRKEFRKFQEFFSKKFFDRSVRSVLRRLGEQIGVLSTTIVIPQLLGWPSTNSPRHVRFVAPPGAFVSDVHLLHDDHKLAESGDPLVNHNIERASLVIREQSGEKRSILIKLNPMTGNLIIPALFVSILQMIIVSIALYVGPEVVTQNAIAFTGTAVVAPFVTVVFIAKESEHSLVGRILSAPRFILALSSAFMVATGALVSVLPRKKLIDRVCEGVDEARSKFKCKDTLLRNHENFELQLISFAGFAIIFTLAIICTFLLLRIAWVAYRSHAQVTHRIKVMRTQVAFDNKPDVSDTAIEKYRKKNFCRNALGLFIIFTGAIFIAAWVICVIIPSAKQWVAI